MPGFEALPQINGGGVRVCRSCGGGVRFRNGNCIGCLLRAGLFLSEQIVPFDFKIAAQEADPRDSA